MKLPCPAIILGAATAVALGWAEVCDGATVVSFEAESGAPGADWAISNSSRPAFAGLSQPIVWRNASTNIADSNGAWQFTYGNNTVPRFYRSYAP